MPGPSCPNPFDNKEKTYFLPEQLNTIERFEWIKRFLGRKGEVSDEELGELIRTLLPSKPEKRESSIRMLGQITPSDDEEKRVLQRIQKVCTSI